MTLKIGDTVYMRTRNISGNKDSGTFRFFTGYQIVGETARSWLVKINSWGEPVKVGKTTMLSVGDRYDGNYSWFTHDQAADEDWKLKNYGQLSRAFQQASAEQLKRVAQVLEFKEDATP